VWWIVGLLAAVVVLLWQIVKALAPIGAYYEHRNARLEQEADAAEFERIRTVPDRSSESP
jgi:hypothetical protein